MVEIVRKKRLREQLESQDSATTACPSATTTKLSGNQIYPGQGGVQDLNGDAPTLHSVVPTFETQPKTQKDIPNADAYYYPSPSVACTSNNQHNHPTGPRELSSFQQPNQQVHSQGKAARNFLTPSVVEPPSSLQTEAFKITPNSNNRTNNIYHAPLTKPQTTTTQTGTVGTNSFNQPSDINDDRKLLPIFSDSSNISSELDLLDF